MLTDEEMLAKNPSAYAKALDMEARIAGGALVDGYNCSKCSDDCGQYVTLESFDIDGPDLYQAEGFKCALCDEFCLTAHGDRGTRVCDACNVYSIAQNLTQIAARIEASSMRCDFPAVLPMLQSLDAVKSDLSEGVRLLCSRRASAEKPAEVA